MEQRNHWWNGAWQLPARRDVYLHTDGQRWIVEAREGGPHGRSRIWRPPTVEDARLLADDLMSDSDGWRELTRRPAEARDNPAVDNTGNSAAADTSARATTTT